MKGAETTPKMSADNLALVGEGGEEQRATCAVGDLYCKGVSEGEPLLAAGKTLDAFQSDLFLVD